MPFDSRRKQTKPNPDKRIVGVKKKLHGGRKPGTGGFNIKRPKDDINYTRARKLLAAIYQANKIRRNLDIDPNLYKGANLLATLNRELNYDHTRLDKAIDWYCSHLEDQYTPKITDIQGFKNKFLKIESAMRREARLRPDLVISPAARRLFKHQQYDFICAKGGHARKTEFLNLCEITYSNVAQTFFWIQEEYAIDDGLPDFMAFCISYLCDIEDWACEKFQTHNWWEHINPIDIAFRAKTHRFNRVMRKWGKINNLEQKLIDEIIKGVNECVSMK